MLGMSMVVRVVMAVRVGQGQGQGQSQGLQNSEVAVKKENIVCLRGQYLTEEGEST